jgi:hypothetical protein
LAKKFSWLSLGVLVLRSTKQLMKLLHIQHGPLAHSQFQEPHSDAVHMICASKGSSLDDLLASKMVAAAKATIIGHRMCNVRWDFILSSDI